MSLTPNLQHSHLSVYVQTDDLVKEMSKFGHVSELSPSSSTWTSTSVAKVGTRFHVKVENKTSEVTSTTYGISIKGDVLYVAESGNHCVQKLTSRGEFSHTFGQTGSGQGQFNVPTADIDDSNNRLIVSDRGNHRIQIFNEVGGWLPMGSCLRPSGKHSCCSPWYYTDIKVFTKEGVYVRTYGDPKGPIGIAIDGEGYSFAICQ